MNDDPVTIGLDLGTGSVKAVALSRDGRIVARHAEAIRTETDEPGHAEQSLEEIEAAVDRVLGQIEADKAKAIALSGAMHSVVGLDADGRPIGRATTWADARGADQLPVIAPQVREVDALYRRTGCPIAALYHIARLRWWRKHRPNAVRFTTICDWIAHRLTGQLRANLSVASATGLVDLDRREYDDEALALAGVTADALPPLSEAAATIGRTDAGVPVITGASDGALANLAADPNMTGALVMTVGTSAATRRLSPEPRFDPCRRTWCYIVDESHYLPGAAMNNGGDALRYVADQYFAGSISDAEAAAGQADADCGGITVLPFVHGERDLIWPHDAQWAVEGDAAARTPANLARATMLSVAACVGRLADVTAPEANDALLTGGINQSPTWMQWLADMTGRTLRPIDAADASAIGAAMIAWRGLGEDVAPCAGSSEATIEPTSAGIDITTGYRERFIAACRERGWMH